MSYEAIIGLEIHAELSTPTKLFCGCNNDPFHAPEPNIYICPVCLALPGSLPVMNRQAVEWAVKVGLALGCQIGWDGMTKWDRKNYFYPDLPKGYQISQYDLPLSHGGKLSIRGREIAITRIHLEEDTGKLVHPAGVNYSLVDYNRAGVPLLELVTEPEIRTGAEAARFGQAYQLLLRTLGVAQADMEKGGMRVEVNISLRPIGQTEFGTKVEIKNLNSFRSVQKSIDYEISRQSELLGAGGKITQETRGWDETKQQTFTQRVKETAADYRYFPEPDLPPVTIEMSKQRLGPGGGLNLEEIKRGLPELPGDRQARYEEDGIPPADAERLVYDERAMTLYDDVTKGLDRKGKITSASLIVNKVFDEPRLIRLVASQKMALSQAKKIRDDMKKTGQSLDQLLKQSSESSQDSDATIELMIDEIVAANPQAMADYRSGKAQVLGFLVGQVMAKSHGTANPATVQETLRNRLMEG